MSRSRPPNSVGKLPEEDHVPSISMGSLSPRRLLAHLTCGIRLKTSSASVCCMNSLHSFVSIHSSRALLLRNFTRSMVSWIASFGCFVRHFDCAGTSGISTGYVSNWLISGENEAWTPILARRVSRRCTGVFA